MPLGHPGGGKGGAPADAVKITSSRSAGERTGLSVAGLRAGGGQFGLPLLRDLSDLVDGKVQQFGRLFR